jgi:hypothetical protein
MTQPGGRGQHVKFPQCREEFSDDAQHGGDVNTEQHVPRQVVGSSAPGMPEKTREAIATTMPVKKTDAERQRRASQVVHAGDEKVQAAV